MNLMPHAYTVGFTPSPADRSQFNDLRELGSAIAYTMNDAIDEAIDKVIPVHLPDKYHAPARDGFRNIVRGQCTFEYPDGAQVWVEFRG
jgi:hypothetical protein